MIPKYGQVLSMLSGRTHSNESWRTLFRSDSRYWQELGYIIIYATARPDIQQHKVVHWLAQHNFPHGSTRRSFSFLITGVFILAGMTLFNNGISREPLKHKAEMVRKAVENGDLLISAAYGSSKDVSIYQSINVPIERTFVVGKIKSRLQNRARFVSDGYALHLGKSKESILVCRSVHLFVSCS